MKKYIFVLVLLFCSSVLGDEVPTGVRIGDFYCYTSEYAYEIWRVRGIETSPVKLYSRKYPIHNMFDDDPKTAWVYESPKKWPKPKENEGDPPSNFNHGVNHWIGVSIDQEKPIMVDKIGITNGYVKTKKTYERNNRILKIKIVLNDDQKQATIHELKETMEIQYIKIPPIKTHDIRITFLEIKEGPDDDLCISELKLFNKDKPIKFNTNKYYFYSPGDLCGCGYTEYLMNKDGKIFDCFGQIVCDDFTSWMSPDSKYALFLYFNVDEIQSSFAIYNLESKKLEYYNTKLNINLVKWDKNGIVFTIENDEHKYIIKYKNYLIEKYVENKSINKTSN